MKPRTMLRAGWVFAALIVATVGMRALRTQAAAGGNHCSRGVKSCSAAQVGPPQGFWRSSVT